MKRLLLLLLLLAASPAQAGVSCSLPFTLTNGTLADANQVMANYNALVQCLSNAAAAGANADITQLSALTTPITPAQGGTNVFIGPASTGTNTVNVASTVPNTFAQTTGNRVVFLVGGTNTGIATLTVGATPAKSIIKQTPSGTAPLTGGELTTGLLAEVIYDGTAYQLVDMPQGLTGAFGAQVSLASAANTDLGTVPTHNVLVTGNASITSFGTTASTIFPFYKAQFNGTATLVFNGTTMILPGGNNIVTQPGDQAFMQYNGAGAWQVVAYARITGTSVVNPTPLCGGLGFTMTNGSPATTTMNYAADSAVLLTVGNIPTYVTGISGTVNTTNGNATSVADGMDGEPRPASAWGYFWLISNGTATNGLISTSNVSPNLPAGYIYRCRLGAMRFDGSQNMVPIQQYGNVTQYISGTMPTSITGVAGAPGTPTWVSAPTVNIVPPTAAATQVSLVMANCVTCGIVTAIAAPNSNYGASSSANPPPLMLSTAQTAGAGLGSQGPQAITSWFNGPGPFSYASGAAAPTGLYVLGWRDRVNAN